MEQRKEKEKSHYENLAKKWREIHENNNQQSDIENYDINIFSSYRFSKDWLKQNVKPKMKILDYGCGHGMHSILPAKLDAKVYAIDFSGESLKIGEQRAKKEGVENRINFIQMDCEKLNFPDNYFDIIWNGGTLSSLNINKAFLEISRTLKQNGKIIGIETFGHNPLANLKRWINKKRGIRTPWATNHILKNKDLKLAKRYFKIEKLNYFHLLSIFVFPFRNFLGGKFLFKLVDKVDNILLKIPFLKKYAFKIVFIFQKK